MYVNKIKIQVQIEPYEPREDRKTIFWCNVSYSPPSRARLFYSINTKPQCLSSRLKFKLPFYVGSDSLFTTKQNIISLTYLKATINFCFLLFHFSPIFGPDEIIWFIAYKDNFFSFSRVWAILLLYQNFEIEVQQLLLYTEYYLTCEHDFLQHSTSWQSWLKQKFNVSIKLVKYTKSIVVYT